MCRINKEFRRNAAAPEAVGKQMALFHPPVFPHPTLEFSDSQPSNHFRSQNQHSTDRRAKEDKNFGQIRLENGLVFCLFAF